MRTAVYPWTAAVLRCPTACHRGVHRCCRHEFAQAGPVLVAAPASSVEHWASNWEFWAGPGVNVVPYIGTSAARALIHDHELWLAPESLDTKTSPWLKQGLPARVGRLALHTLSA